MPAENPRFAETHAAILTAGQQAFRAKGYKGTSLRDVMGAVGLTIGGFYAHFGSKADLFQACFEKAGKTGLARVFGGVGPGEWHKVVERYLSDAHVGAKADGCPLAALLSELDQIRAEGPLPVVDAYLSGFGRELAKLGADPERALALLSLMVGTLGLARAVADPKLKKAIITQALRAARAVAAGKPGKERK